MIVIGFFGTLLGDPKVLMYFALYFIAVALVVFTMLERIFVLRVVLFVLNLIRGNKKRKLSQHDDEVETAGAGDHDDAAAPIVQVSEMLLLLLYTFHTNYFAILYNLYRPSKISTTLQFSSSVKYLI